MNLKLIIVASLKEMQEGIYVKKTDLFLPEIVSILNKTHDKIIYGA